MKKSKKTMPANKHLAPAKKLEKKVTLSIKGDTTEQGHGQW